MSKKIYFVVGAIVVIIAVAVGIYWYFHFQRQGTTVSSEEQELGKETENLSQDISDLKTVEEDKSLDTLDEDLSAVAEETPLSQKLAPTETSIVNVDEIESLENELNAELDGISNDLTDLEGFEGDSSLDNLDNSLSGITQ